MKTSDFDFELPEHLIAQRPLARRDDSRMMVVHRRDGCIEHRRVSELPDLLSRGDLLVVNDTRVLPARLFGVWEDTGGRLEVLFVEERAPGEWECLCRASRTVRVGMRAVFAGGELRGHVADIPGGGRVVFAFGAAPIIQVLQNKGVMPLPPYIKRQESEPKIDKEDRERYQTIFAKQRGAVAAPTAGLHFTQPLLDELEVRGIKRTAVTLHVGPGTFRPVKTETVEAHKMEGERFEISPETAESIEKTRVRGGRLVAVGSTVVRTIESVFQEHGRILPAKGRSALFIYPPFEFRGVDAMLTNFHLPRSTLLMMVCAFAGHGISPKSDAEAGQRLILQAYGEAIRHSYRFYSYGDCMLLI